MFKELIEKRNDLVTRAEEIVNKAKEEKRELTEDEIKSVNEIKESVRSIDDSVKAEEEVREMSKYEKKETRSEESEEMDEEMKQRAVEEAEERAFDAYVRGIVLEERGDPVNMTKGANGAVIPKSIARRIIAKVYDICPILERSSTYNAKGTLSLPYYDENSTSIVVDYQEEFVPMSSSVGEFKAINLTGYLAGALTLISRSLINNTEINITDYIVDRMAYAIKRWIEKELLVGTENKITGLSTLNASVTTAAADEITADEIVKLHDAIKDEYQSDAVFIMHPTTRTALRLLKDQMHRYLLQDDISMPFGSSLLGKPVWVSDNMPEIGSGNAAVYYGDMKGLATKFNENISIEILREKYADMHAIGVVGWFEMDGKVEDAQKIAKLVCATE